MPFSGPVEDRVLIRELLSSYCDAVNQRDAEAWGRTWAEDSVWELPHLAMDKISGREAIVASWLEAMKLFPFVNMLAEAGSIEVDGDRATMRSYTSEVAVMQDGTEIRPVGRYDDVCVRRDGRWQFAHRTFSVLHGE
ncbi:MAG: nuclear transport factor 2 family protein [Parahaliea sp.]